jgi:hypothetical protein
MKKILLSLVTLALVGAGCTSGGPQTTNQSENGVKTVNEYADEKNNFRFEYPLDWTVTKKEANGVVTAEFKDADGEAVMWAKSPESDMGVSDVADVYKVLNVAAKDGTNIKATLLRSCAEYDTFEEDSCVYYSNGFSGEAYWKNVKFEFSSFAENDSPEEQKMVEMFENILKSVSGK